MAGAFASEDDMTLTASEWASWALLGDQSANVPPTLADLYERIRLAIVMAKKEAIAFQEAKASRATRTA